jgi:hypothetical protein
MQSTIHTATITTTTSAPIVPVIPNIVIGPQWTQSPPQPHGPTGPPPGFY